jgi:protein-tyrosine phosphatase
MNQVQPHRLWVGHAGDGRDFRRLFGQGIEAVVQLAEEEAPLAPPHEILYCRFPLLDGGGNRPEVLSLAVQTLAALVRLRVPTLACCGIGMSRSPAVAAAALSLVSGETPEACLTALAQHHPCDVSTTLWRDIKACLASAG